MLWLADHLLPLIAELGVSHDIFRCPVVINDIIDVTVDSSAYAG